MGPSSFPPLCSEDARILILGTYPSPLSFESGFYYGHPRNRFWPLLAGLLDEPVPRTVEEKKALLVKKKVGLWDVLDRCEMYVNLPAETLALYDTLWTRLGI